MAELKTQKTTASVAAFLNTIDDEARRRDAKWVAKCMREATGAKAVMWGDSIVGFDTYEYPGAGGRSREWFVVGFSPRKSSLTLYIMPGFLRHGALLKRLGKYKTGKSCLYINRLGDVDTQVLRELIAASVAAMKSRP